MRRRAAAAAGLALAVACLRGDRVREPATITVLPEAAAVVAGGPGVELHARPRGELDVIRWSLAGPGWLTATEGELTAYVPPDRAAAGTSVLVTARMREAAATCRIRVDPGPAFALRSPAPPPR